MNLAANSRLHIQGADDTINVGAGSDLFAYGNSHTIMLGAGDNLWLDSAYGSKILLSAKSEVIDTFVPGNNDILDLTNGAGGYHSSADVMRALHSDGRGGALLSLGSGASVDILNVAPSQLTAANFQIG